MDPHATLDLLVRAALAGDAARLTDHAQDLADWLRRGGFPPARESCEEIYSPHRHATVAAVRRK